MAKGTLHGRSGAAKSESGPSPANYGGIAGRTRCGSSRNTMGSVPTTQSELAFASKEMAPATEPSVRCCPTVQSRAERSGAANPSGPVHKFPDLAFSGSRR